MNRRDFLTSAPATAALVAVPTPHSSCERPWAARGRELEERDGMWSDYTAWREWIERRMNETMPNGLDEHLQPVFDPPPFLDILDEANELHDIYLYSLMCDLSDGRKEPTR